MPTEFKSAGEFLQALAFKEMHPGERIHFGPRAERLVEMLAAGSDEARETADYAGGFAVFADFAAELLRRAFDFSPIASRCLMLPPISGASLKAPVWRETSRANGSRLGGISSAWQGETLAIPSSIGTFAGVTLSPHSLRILCYVTEELLADAASLESTLQLGASEELAVRVDQAVIGTSLTDSAGVGMPAGLMGGPSGPSDPSVIIVAKDQGQGAATISATNITSCVGRLWPYSHKNAVWVCSISALTAILNSVELNNSNLLRFAGPALGDGFPRMTLAGFPLIPAEQCQPAGTQGDLMLADFGEYTLASKGLPAIAQSAEVRFVGHERTFRFVLRIDGHSRWLGPVTSMNESTTVSPFIAIATRS